MKFLKNANISPVHLNLDLESLHLIQSLQFFSKNVKKITSVGWSSRCKFFWNALDPTLVIFFGNEKIFISKKITSVGSSAFQKNLQRLDQTDTFLTFFEKNYNDWIKCKLSKSKFRWTGLFSFSMMISTYFSTKKISNFFQLRKLITNGKNQTIFSIEKGKYFLQGLINFTDIFMIRVCSLSNLTWVVYPKNLNLILCRLY